MTLNHAVQRTGASLRSRRAQVLSERPFYDPPFSSAPVADLDSVCDFPISERSSFASPLSTAAIVEASPQHFHPFASTQRALRSQLLASRIPTRCRSTEPDDGRAVLGSRLYVRPVIGSTFRAWIIASVVERFMVRVESAAASGSVPDLGRYAPSLPAKGFQGKIHPRRPKTQARARPLS